MANLLFAHPQIAHSPYTSWSSFRLAQFMETPSFHLFEQKNLGIILDSWLSSLHPIPSVKLVGSTFKIYPDSDHCSSPSPLPSGQYSPRGLLQQPLN